MSYNLRRLVFGLLLTVTFIFSANSCAHTTQESKHFTIIHTNDVHSHVDDDLTIGYTKLATVVNDLRRKQGNILLLDAGDTFYGMPAASITKGENIVELLNALKYDLMIPGNHEFDYGTSRLLELSKKLSFPIMTSNIFTEAGNLFLGDKRYYITSINGIKVGVLGITTPSTKIETHPKNVSNINFDISTKEIAKLVNELKAIHNAEFIIVLAHLEDQRIASNQLTVNKIASEVKDIDLIIEAHDHNPPSKNRKVANTQIVCSNEYMKYIGMVNVTLNPNGEKIIRPQSISKDESNNIKDDPKMLQLIKDQNTKYSPLFNKVVGTLDETLDGSRNALGHSQTKIGYFISDILRDKSKADIAFMNSGGLRGSFNAGNITVGDIHVVMPFGNSLVSTKLTGAEIKEVMEHGHSMLPKSNGGFLQTSSNLSYDIDISKPVGSRVSNIIVDGKKLQPNKLYMVATNDFIFYGGNGYKTFKDKAVLKNFDQLDVIMTEYFTTQQGMAK